MCVGRDMNDCTMQIQLVEFVGVVFRSGVVNAERDVHNIECYI